MVWLEDVAQAATDWERLSLVAPDAVDALTRMVDSVWDDVDPVLVELTRRRIAELLGNSAELARHSDRARRSGLTDERSLAVRTWPTSPLFDDRERACLHLAEQFVLDANGVTDADVAAVTSHLGAQGCYAFVEAVSVLETFQRACITLGVSTLPALPSVPEERP